MKSWEEMRQDIRNNPKLDDAQKQYLLKEIDDYERAEKAYSELSDDEKEQHNRDLNDMLLL